MVNGDILGRHHAAERIVSAAVRQSPRRRADFQMREGSRDRTQLRIGVSGTDVSLVVEGPLGGDKAGIVAVLREEELSRDAVGSDRDDNDFGFGFSDAQSKLVYDVSPRHRLELSLVAGRSSSIRPRPSRK